MIKDDDSNKTKEMCQTGMETNNEQSGSKRTIDRSNTQGDLIGGLIA